MQIYYENQNGDTIDLINSDYWYMESQDGLTSLPENTLTQKNTIFTEGSYVQSRRREARQIVINITFIKNVRECRRYFVDVLDEENKGKIRYIDDEIDVFIDCEVESCEITNTDERTKAVLTFLCPYPYFLDHGETRQAKKSVQGMFSFPFTFPITFGTTSNSNNVIIENTGAIDIGFEFTLKAVTGVVSNIKITNQIGEYLSLQGFTMLNGDVIKFSSIDNNKYILCERSNTEINLLGYFQGTFYQMHKGSNTLQLTATGAENAQLEVVCRGAHKAV